MESIPLSAALGRILALPIRADRNLPPFRRATRDGFAVTATQLQEAKPVKIIGSVRAGEAWPTKRSPLQKTEAVAIMTGAPVPAGADAVLMIEHAVVAGDLLTLAQVRKISSGENIVPEATEARAGETLVAAGMRLTPAEIALAATCGCNTVSVYAQPRVAIFSTGDELVDAAVTPQASQIRNSNGPALSAMLQAVGGALPDSQIDSQILPDDTNAIESVLRNVLSSNADLLLLSGGVSVGEYDLVEAALARLGAEFIFTGVAMQPGKPVVFGKISTQRTRPLYFFGLPGNPVSVQVCFLLFVQPLLSALAGALPTPPRFALTTLDEAIQTKPGLTKFLPALFTSTWNTALVRRIPWQGSGDLTANARANCYLVLPPDCEELSAGTIVSVLLR
jgi:molybdopterin molybdotransferase